MKKAAISLTTLALLSLIIYPIEVAAQITHPSPSYEYSPLTPRVGDIVTFDASDFIRYWTESTIVSLVWDFADGTTQTGTVVKHSFAQPGTYWVDLSATDNRGLTASTAHLVTVREQTPITVYVSLSNRVYVGQETIISGNLTYDGKGVPDAIISLSTKTYSDDAEWITIGTAKTNEDGIYSFSWAPQHASGYQVKAAWDGNSTYPETSLNRNIYVVSFGDLITGFSSNSTVTEMNFNMTTRLLSFTAEGPSGTSGYVNVTLEKDPSFNPQTIIVLLDGQPIQFTIESTDQSWTLYFTYKHSIHNILVDFTGATIGHGTINTPTPPAERNSPKPFLPATTLVAVSAALLAVILVSVLIYLKKRSTMSKSKV